MENPINKFYSSFTDGATKEVPAIKDITKRRIQIPELYKDKKILVVGDAFSHESNFMRSLGFQNITSTIKHEREAKIGSPIICDLHSLPFADAEFDFVFCSHVLEHCVAPLIALREIYRVLNSSGEALLWMPYSDKSQKVAYHLSCFRPAVWNDLIRKAGFGTFKEENYKPREEWGYWVRKIIK